MSDLISRQAVADWINKQREEVTKKQVAGTDGTIFTREALVTMQRCIGTFENFINNLPTAYNVDVVVEEAKEVSRYVAYGNRDRDIGMTHRVVPFDVLEKIVRKGGVDEW